MRFFIYIVLVVLVIACRSQGGRESLEQTKRLEELVARGILFENIKPELAPSVPYMFSDEREADKTIRQFARNKERAFQKAAKYKSVGFVGLTPNVTAVLYFDEGHVFRDFEIGVQ